MYGDIFLISTPYRVTEKRIFNLLCTEWRTTCIFHGPKIAQQGPTANPSPETHWYACSCCVNHRQLISTTRFRSVTVYRRVSAICADGPREQRATTPNLVRNQTAIATTKGWKGHGAVFHVFHVLVVSYIPTPPPFCSHPFHPDTRRSFGSGRETGWPATPLTHFDLFERASEGVLHAGFRIMKTFTGVAKTDAEKCWVNTTRDSKNCFFLCV